MAIRSPDETLGVRPGWHHPSIVKLSERVQVIDLLRRHPGWSDRRVADQVGVSPDTVGRWRREAGLLPYTKKVGWRRERGII